MLTYSLQGDKELAAKLSTLTKSEFKSAVQFGAKKAMAPAQQTARSVAPKNTGKLRRAIRVRVLKRSRKRVGARVTIGAHESMFKGRTFYAAFQEYGWRTGKRASNQDLGVAKRKRRTASQREEIATMNASRKKIQGKRYLKKSIDSTREMVMHNFKIEIRAGIHKVMKRSASKKFLPVIRN
jgi:HK97 gp10 family phage protein